MNVLLKYLFFLFSLALAFNCAGQSIDSIGGAIQNIPSTYYSKVQRKYSAIDNNLSKKSIKYLEKLQKQEDRINSKLSSVDSLAAKANEAVTKKYESFIQEFKQKKDKLGKVNLNEYNSYIDTLSTSLSFLKKLGSEGKAALPLEKLNQLKDKFNQTAKVNEFINERKQQIQQLLSKYTKLPGSVTRQFDKMRKTAYYYKVQINEYKNMLRDPKKIEETAIKVLNKIPAFQKFMKENSAIAGLFRIPADYGTAQSLSGFQTRAQVQQLITNRMGGGPNVGRLFGQQIQAAQGKLDKFKEKLNALKGGSGDIEMPDFKPNNQKSKPFLQRLEYGSNIQTTRGNYFFPTTTDIGLSVGYKLNNKSTIGIGVSYKSGWGKDIQHIYNQ